MLNNKLARNYNLFSLLKFALPTIVMTMFMSLYTIVDGMFVSRFIGTDALAAVNVVFPIISAVYALATMLACGGSAIIAQKMGTGHVKEARQNFTFFTIFGVVLGVLFTIVGLIFIDPIIKFLGATDKTYQFCYDYAFVLLFLAPIAILQMFFQSAFVAAGKPVIGLLVTITGGLINMIMDYVLIVPVKLGIQGAAIATGLGMLFPAVFGLIYFSVARRGTLFFTRTKADGKALLKACSNGSSEAVTNLANAVTTFLFNMLMLKYAGEDGVAAITIVLYSQFLITSLFLGYSTGVAPIISYNHGCGNHKQLRKIFLISIGFIVTMSAVLFAMTFLINKPVISLFSKDNPAVLALATRGFFLYSFAFLIMGMNIFGSSLFTALSNGLVSATISFLRTFVFLIGSLLLLPLALKVDGVWLAVPIAEIITLIATITFMILLRKKYHYAKSKHYPVTDDERIQEIGELCD